MQIKEKKIKRVFILLLIIIAIIFFLLLINKNKLVKNDMFARGEFEVEFNGLNISLDNVISKIPNEPAIGAGMIPIKWNESANLWEITTKSDSEWYDYSNGQYANIMLSDGYYKSELEVGIDENSQLMSNNIGAQIADTSKLRNNLYLGTKANV